MSLHRAAGVLCVVVAAPALASALGTGFTYQGRLTQTGAPVSGSYDLEFKLYGAASGGSQVGSTIVSEDVIVTAGVFTVPLDFGSAFDGSERWLEIGVRPGAATGAFETLSPRQHLTASPYALHASGAANAASLECLACVTEGELAFDPATQTELAAHQGSSDHDGRYARLLADNSFTGTQSVTGDVSATGTVSAAGVKLGTVVSACTASADGTLRYNAATKQVEYCDGTAWTTLTGPPGPSGVANHGQVSWAATTNISAGAWVTIPNSSLNITTSGTPVMITIDTYLNGGSHSTCRPIIDGVWAGSFGGLPDPGSPFWPEGLTNAAGGNWHPWHKTRLYPGVPAGNHTLTVQCATDGGTLIVGASSIVSSVHFVELRP